MSMIYFHITPSLEIYSSDREVIKANNHHNPIFPTDDKDYSPLSNFYHNSIDLNSALFLHPDETYMARVKDTSLEDCGFNVNDMLIVDRSISPLTGQMALCYFDGHFSAFRIKIDKAVCWLVSDKENHQPIKISSNNRDMIWGIITHVIKRL